MFSSQSNLSMAPPLPPLPKFDENFEIIETPPPLPELSEKLQAEMELDMRKIRFQNMKKDFIDSLYNKYKLVDKQIAKKIYDYMDEDELTLNYNNYKLPNGNKRFIKVNSDSWLDMQHAENIIIKKGKFYIRRNDKNYDVNKRLGRKYFDDEMIPDEDEYSGYASAEVVVDILRYELDPYN
jgi:hypothetical protein